MASTSVKSRIRSVKRRDSAIVVCGAVFCTGLTIVTLIGLRSMNAYKAWQMLESVMPTTRFLTSSIMAAASTILALMLTLLALSVSSDKPLKPFHYHRLKQIAKLATISIIASCIFLAMHSIPIRDSENVPKSWYDAIYYSFVATSGLLSGLMVAVVLLLYLTVRDMINIFGGSGKHWLQKEERQMEEDSERAKA